MGMGGWHGWNFKFLKLYPLCWARTYVVHGSTPIEIGTGVQSQGGDKTSDRAHKDLVVVWRIVTRREGRPIIACRPKCRQRYTWTITVSEGMNQKMRLR